MSPRDATPVGDSVALPAGSALHEYQIDRVLGSGGFGVTYLATDQNLHAKVAIKEYLPSDVAARLPDNSVQPRGHKSRELFDWGLQRFIDESRTLATFHHSAIVRVLRFFEANNTAYMVMEFVHGDPLGQWIKPFRPLPQDNLLALSAPLMEGLDVVHKAGFLHRDIKPGNIYVKENGAPVLLDFGAARSTKGPTDLTSILSPGFAPFEQYSGGNQGPWSDIYALGAVLYWIVTGNKPPESISRVRRDLIVPAVDAGDKNLYSLSLLSAIDWALKVNEDERPQSVDEFRKAFLDGAQSHIVDVKTVPQGKLAPRPTRAVAAPSARGSTVTLTSLGVFERETLKEISTELAKHIGPMASIIVGRAAKSCLSLADLAEQVGAEIAEEGARAQFIRKITKGEVSRRPSGNTQLGERSVMTRTSLSQLAQGKFAQEVLERAERQLAHYLGAIARVVVRRTAAKARDETELYLMLADEIQDKAQREAFVRQAMSAANSGKE